ncbi:MAG: glycoside hydrolase family 99-like domain-containing protein [Planctomycetaceae bacterium]|nr:glycoside hydrolase family 99-like domain-containing protein [Planctomycetaceae bacterium]
MRQPYDIAAYYWPAYHDEPRWRRFMPQGQGEWQTIRAAAPKFEGHWQPRVPAWGYQDESDPRVMEQKIAAAAGHGVNVFIFDWYWYDNQPFLEEALNRGFLGAGNNGDIRFYIMWANHDASTLWDLEQSHAYKQIYPGAVDRPTFDTATQRLIERYFGHPSYYRIDDKPVLSIYEVGTLIRGLGGLDAAREALESLRRRVAAAGFAGLHLQAILWRNVPPSKGGVLDAPGGSQAETIAYLGFDSLTNYQWAHYVPADGPYDAWGRAATAAWGKWADEFSIAFYPHVSIGWDTNPRFKTTLHGLVTQTSPELFGGFMRQAMDFVDARRLAPRLITVNSWNEWSEGSYLEPDTVFGNGYLEAVRRALGGL